MPAIAPGESPELDSLTISVAGTDSVISGMMVGIVVVLDASSVVMLDTSVVAVNGTVGTASVVLVSGVVLFDNSASSCPPHRNTVRKIKKG